MVCRGDMRWFFLTAAVVCTALAGDRVAASHARALPPIRLNTSHAGELRWFNFGDWGACTTCKTTRLQQLLVARQMDEKAKTWLPDLLITNGDNFYESGVTSVTDDQWLMSWRQPYNHSSLQLPWYACLGNHDYIDNPQAQVEFSTLGLGDGLWRMPARYYSQTFLFGNQSAQFVFVDTVMLSPNTTLRVSEQEVARGEVTPAQHAKLEARLRVDEVPFNATAQLDWIKVTLASSTADWLFVVGHYPVYSGGSHGDTPELQAQLKPLLVEYGVDAYMSGHDHTLQLLTEDGVYYYVSGGASKVSSHMTQLPQTLYGADQILGFATMKIDGEALEMEYRDEFGKKVFSYTQPRRVKPQRSARV